METVCHPTPGVIPAKAGIQCTGTAGGTAARTEHPVARTGRAWEGTEPWIPAFAGMTRWLWATHGAAHRSLRQSHPRHHPFSAPDIVPLVKNFKISG